MHVWHGAEDGGKGTYPDEEEETPNVPTVVTLASLAR